MRKMRKSFLDEKYRPTGQSILKESKISAACGAVCLVIYGLLVFTAYENQGQAGKFVGLLGWILVFGAGVGMYYGVNSMQQPGGKISVKILGIILNAAVWIIMLYMMMRGIA